MSVEPLVDHHNDGLAWIRDVLPAYPEGFYKPGAPYSREGRLPRVSPERKSAPPAAWPSETTVGKPSPRARIEAVLAATAGIAAAAEASAQLLDLEPPVRDAEEEDGVMPTPLAHHQARPLRVLHPESAHEALPPAPNAKPWASRPRRRRRPADRVADAASLDRAG